MRQYLLPRDYNFYKANLHTHTTISDGTLTPQEMKRAYMARGYSIVAFTDHEILADHSDLNEEGFLALHGYELAVNERGAASWPETKTCHMNFYALDPHNTTQVCFHPEHYFFCGKDVWSKIKYTGSLYHREHTPECINDMIKTAHENGFIASYNHPGWSDEDARDYTLYNGFFAMEIYNHGSDIAGGFAYNIRDYDIMLRSGHRLFCMAGDDNHNDDINDPFYDSFGGFNMIKAPELSYGAVMDALVHGDFYASQGPEIHDLYHEDGRVFIKCSPAKKIYCTTRVRHNQTRFGYEGYISEAEFTVSPGDRYIRISVIDEYGRRANTRAYFIDEFL